MSPHSQLFIDVRPPNLVKEETATIRKEMCPTLSKNAAHHILTQGPPGTGYCGQNTKLSLGPPHTRSQGLGAGIVEY